MALNLVNLDSTTRSLMLEEINSDITGGTLYISARLTARGREDWPPLLLNAARSGEDDTLARELRVSGRPSATEQRTKSGKTTNVKLPHTAAETFAEGEFNRFYKRGVCRRAIAEGIPYVEVYRAKAVKNPRRESEARIGARLDPQQFLEDQRRIPGTEPDLDVLGGPNSGLSVRLLAH